LKTGKAIFSSEIGQNMRNKASYLTLLGLIVTLLFVQCTVIQENEVQDQPDFLFYTTRIYDLGDKNITWLFEEASQSVYYETKVDSLPVKGASRKIVGYYEKPDVKFFVITQIQQYAEPVLLDDFEKIDFGFSTDSVVVPDVMSLGLEQRVECGQKDATESIKYGYNACTLQVHLENNYFFSVFIHGDGRLTIQLMEDFLNEILHDLQVKLKI
jgi:hypothetical protein